MNPFGLSDPDFWSSPYRTLPDFAWDRIGEGLSGVVIGCPDRVDVDTHSTLPMLAYYSASLRERARTPFDHAVVVAVEQAHGILCAAVAEPREQPPQQGDPGNGFAGSEHLVDLRDRLVLPWAAGSWSVLVLLREQCSNRVAVQLDHGEHVYVDRAVERTAAATRASQAAAALHARHGDPVVRTAAAAGTPPLPEEIGIVLAGDRVVQLTPGALARVGLSFRLPVEARDIVRPEGEPPQATPPLHLVAVGSRSPTPIAVPVRVVASVPEERADGAMIATGHAELDLLRLNALPAQTYVLRAFARSVVSEPLTVALVPAEAER